MNRERINGAPLYYVFMARLVKKKKELILTTHLHTHNSNDHIEAVFLEALLEDKEIMWPGVPRVLLVEQSNKGLAYGNQSNEARTEERRARDVATRFLFLPNDPTRSSKRRLHQN